MLYFLIWYFLGCLFYLIGVRRNRPYQLVDIWGCFLAGFFGPAVAIIVFSGEPDGYHSGNEIDD